MMKMLMFTFSLLLTFNGALGYRYALPGDASWPTFGEFFNLKISIAGNVMFKNDQNYKPHTWNMRTNLPKPAVIVQPKNANDVITALKFAKQHNIRLSVQSTGHHQDTRNIFDNSVHLDMSSMNSKSIDLAKRTLTLGPGNNFTQIHTFVAMQSNRTLVAAGGADPGVGIYGWTTGGGHGYMTRLYGLGVDQLLSIDIVLANFTIITASESQNQELFRAIRGSGGGSYGIATSLTIKLHDDPGKISTFTGIYELKKETATMFGNWMTSVPDQVLAYFLPSNIDDKKYVLISAICYGNWGFCFPILSRLNTGCLRLDASLCTPAEKYNNFFEFFSDQKSDRGGGSIYMASLALNAKTIVPGLVDIFENFLNNNPFTTCSGNSVLGGKSATLDLNQDKTSVSLEMRQSLMAITCVGITGLTEKQNEKEYIIDIMDKKFGEYAKKYSSWVYWNEPQHNFPSNDWTSRYWGGKSAYNRLTSVKKTYDPDHFFTCYHCVGYDEIENEIADPCLCPNSSCSCSNTPNGQCAPNYRKK